MRASKLVTILVITVVAAVAPLSAAPGDSCGEAISVLPGVTGGDLASGSRWYGFEAGRDGSIPFNTSLPGTEFETRLSIYGGCGGSPIGTSDGDPPRKAHLVLDAFNGQQFFIEVSSVNGGGGHFELAVDAQTFGPQCPGVGDCFSANGSVSCDDTCSASPCPGCCDTICTADAFCCSTDWDQICADAAIAACVVIPVDLKNFEIDG